MASVTDLIAPIYSPRLLKGITCVFDDFDFVREGWATEAVRLFLHSEIVTADRAKAAQNPRLLRLTRDRLKLLNKATEENTRSLQAPLAPLGFATLEREGVLAAIMAEVEKKSDLIEHYDNLFRDWAWNSGETDAMVELAMEVWGDGPAPTAVLNLGAGAARFIYDLHSRWKPQLTVATDINPLLFLAVEKIVRGEALDLYEFPPVPLNGASAAVKRTLKTPVPLDEKFQLVLTDVAKPCWRAESFDLVVTSWFLDVAPMPPQNLAQEIRRCLKPGGKWLNLGPLMYRTPVAENLFSAEETLALVEKSGFDVGASRTSSLPYLDSPARANKRLETVLAFTAVKNSSEPSLDWPLAEEAWPLWLRDFSTPIELPINPGDLMLANVVIAEALAKIDGQISMSALSADLAAQFELPETQVRVILSRHLARLSTAVLGNPYLKG